MTIHLYANAWNEEPMLGFFFRHYQPYVDRFVIYDDGSTDRTLDILRSQPKVEVRTFPRAAPDSFVLSEMALHNACWKESRGQADWVIVTDIDEHLYHEDLLGYLGACKRAGATAIPAVGFDILTDAFPGPDERLCETRRTGCSAQDYSKLRVFDPDAITDLNLGLGGHFAQPVGDVRAPARDALRLFHYRHLGEDFVLGRRAELAAKLGAVDRGHGWGRQYSEGAEIYRGELSEKRGRMVDTSDPDFDLDVHVNRVCWWRSDGGNPSFRNALPSVDVDFP